MALSTEKLREHFWFLFGVVGVVFFWVGVWDGIGEISLLKKPLVSLAAGVAMLITSRFIFKETDPEKARREATHQALREVHQHPQKEQFHIKYLDRIKQSHVLAGADKLHKIEKGFLIFLQEGREIFVPFHRIAEIHYRGQLHKRLKAPEEEQEK